MDGHEGPGIQLYVPDGGAGGRAAETTAGATDSCASFLSNKGLIVFNKSHEPIAKSIPNIAFQMHCFASLFPPAEPEPIKRIPQMTIMMTASTPTMPMIV